MPDKSLHELMVDVRKQVALQEVLCPRCQKTTYTPSGHGVEYLLGISSPHGVLSMYDHRTYICVRCSDDEALEDFAGVLYEGEPYWDTSSPYYQNKWKEWME